MIQEERTLIFTCQECGFNRRVTYEAEASTVWDEEAYQKWRAEHLQSFHMHYCLPYQERTGYARNH